MGAWGFLFDENDDAADWLGEFGESPNWASVDLALAVDENDYLEAPEAWYALAAAEVVAAGLGKASSRLDDSIAGWASSSAGEAAARKQQAILALEKARDDSELHELWEGSDEYPKWQASVNETLLRLGAEAL